MTCSSDCCSVSNQLYISRFPAPKHTQCRECRVGCLAQPESHTHHGGVFFAAFHCLHCKLVGFLIQPNRHTTGIICAS